MAVCKPIAFAPANIRRVNANCTIASPPEMVRPPPSEAKGGREIAQAVQH